MAAKQLEPYLPATNILNIIYGYHSTEIILQAHRLQIFDKLENAGQPLEVTKLAQDLSVDAGALERLLNACAALGIVIRSEVNSQVFFTNSEEAHLYLTQKSPYNISKLFAYVEAFKIPTFKLDGPVRKGTPQAHVALKFSTPDPEDMFKTCYGTKERFSTFVHAMEALAKTGLHLLKSLKLGAFANAIDLGGCLGIHTRTLKSLYPNMKVTLADMKPVIEEAKKQEDNKNAGIEYVECDFFNASTLPEADLYLLGHVLHNWNDEQCRLILQNVYQALGTGGCILLLEKMMDVNKTGNLFLNYSDLIMLVVAHGKERTQKEYRDLLEAQGFEDVTIQQDDNSAYYDAILAYKK